jgi:hypothetical protein
MRVEEVLNQSPPHVSTTLRHDRPLGGRGRGERRGARRAGPRPSGQHWGSASVRASAGQRESAEAEGLDPNGFAATSSSFIRPITSLAESTSPAWRPGLRRGCDARPAPAQVPRAARVYMAAQIETDTCVRSP